MERIVKPGQFYKHFKDKLYQIVAVAEHSENGEQMVVYQALYGDFRIYVRPYDMFVSEVDHEKYPEVTQKYRFEQIILQPQETAAKAVEKETMIEDTSVSEADCEENGKQPELGMEQEEETVNPDLLAFLELDTLAEKLEMFRDLKKRMDERLLDSIAASLDIVVEEGPFEKRYQEVLRCLQTMEHFECSRFR